MTSGIEVPGVTELTVTTPGSPWTLCYDAYIDRVRRVLRDDSKQFISDQEIIDDINEARLDLAWRYRAIKSTATGSLNAGDTTIPVAQFNMFEPELLRITPTDATLPFEVEFVADDVWFSYFDVGQIPNRTIGRYRNGTVTIYPAVNVTFAWSLDYIAKPGILQGTGDCDTIPDVLQRKAVAYARAQSKKKLNEMIAAELYDGQYQEGMPSGDVNQLYTSRGPMQLIPLGNAFDADPDAMHR